MTSYVASIDIGGTNLKAGLVTRDLRINAETIIDTNSFSSPEALVEGILDLATATVDYARNKGCEVHAIGLSVPGIVNPKSGVAVSSMILGWENIPFVKLLQERTDLPIGFGHDVDTAAYAEQVAGAAGGLTDWLFVTLGTGVGSTFMLGGRAYRGSNGFGGELAHVIALSEGPTCRCGKNACLEAVSSAHAIISRYQKIMPDAEHLQAKDIVERAVNGDPAAKDIWNEAIEGLANALAGYIEAMNPSAVIIGGGLSNAEETLFTPLIERLTPMVAFAQPFPKIAKAHFGAKAGIIGAAISGWKQVEDTQIVRSATQVSRN